MSGICLLWLLASYQSLRVTEHRFLLIRRLWDASALALLCLILFEDQELAQAMYAAGLLAIEGTLRLERKVIWQGLDDARHVGEAGLAAGECCFF